MLRGGVNLLYRGVDLPYAGSLLHRGGRDFLHQVGSFRAGTHDFFQQLAGTLGHGHAAAGHFANLLRRYLAALGQLAYLGRHHGKAFAVFARTRCLDRCVQRQQVGLVGNVVHDADLVGNLAHGHHGLFHGVAAFCCLARGLGGNALGQLGVVAGLVDGRGHFFYRRRGFLYAGGRFASALRQRLRGGAHLLRGRRQVVGVAAYLGHDAAQLVDSHGNGRGQAGGVTRFYRHIHHQVALCHFAHGVGHVVRLATQRAGDVTDDQHGHHNTHYQRDDGHGQHLHKSGVVFVVRLFGHVKAQLGFVSRQVRNQAAQFAHGRVGLLLHHGGRFFVLVGRT